MIQRGGVSQAPVNLGGLCLFIDPVAQATPSAHQAFVGDVDDGFYFNLHLAGRHEKGAAGLAEGVEHLAQVRFFAAADFVQFRQLHRAADSPVGIDLLSKGLEQFLGDTFVFVIRQGAIHLVGVAAEGLAHAASGLVMLEVKCTVATAFLKQIPCAHEGMLEDG